MRVLVTRPLRQAERTAQRLRDMGHEPILLPLFEPMHDSAAAIGALDRSGGPIAVTSAEAVLAANASPELLKRHLQRTVYAVGDASADEARAAGFSSVFTASGDGSQLAELITGKARDVVIYLTGSPRAQTFETTARELGIPINVVECYGMRPLDVDDTALEALRASPPAAVLFYSSQTADRFFQCLKNAPWLAAAHLACLSDAVAAAVPLKLQANIRIAAAPDEKSLLSIL